MSEGRFGLNPKGLNLIEGYEYDAIGFHLWVRVVPATVDGSWHIAVFRMGEGEQLYTKWPVPTNHVALYLKEWLKYDNNHDWSETTSRPQEQNPCNENSSGIESDFPGYVYFIQETPNGLIKIGYSKNPEQRLARIQAHSPVNLHIVAMFKANRGREKGIHKRFSDLRRHGEWFEPTEELSEFIDWAAHM